MQNSIVWPQTIQNFSHNTCEKRVCVAARFGAYHLLKLEHKNDKKDRREEVVWEGEEYVFCFGRFGGFGSRK